MTIITELHYFPSILYCHQILKSDQVVLESNENFQKQSYRNRCYVLSANGVIGLTVPVIKSASKSIKDIKIDYSQNWQQVHLRTLSSAYGNSAYFEYFFDGFEKIIMSKRQNLFDLNLEILTKCLSILKIENKILFTEIYQNEYTAEICDVRNQFSIEKIKPEENRNDLKKYYQLFGNVFVKHLSIIDLIFNEGTNAKQYLYDL